MHPSRVVRALRPLLLIAAAVTLCVACDDSASTVTPTDTGTGGDTGGDTTADPDTATPEDTGEPGDATDTAEPGDTGQPGDTAGDATDADTTQTTDSGAMDTSDDADMEMCTGTLCGTPAMCCEVGNECIEGQCLPSCDSGIRCGAAQDVCCNTGEVCIAGACAAPGGSCGDSYDCAQPGEFCEPTLGQCLPQPDPVTCTLTPQFDALNVTLEGSYTEEEVISPPFVADVDGDGTPDIVLNAAKQNGGGWPAGNIVVLDGITLTEKWREIHDPVNGHHGSHGRSSIGLGDVNGDALPDIVYAGYNDDRHIYAIDGFGNPIWTAFNPDGSTAITNVVNGAATLANFDSDPMAEIVFGGVLIDHDGRVVWNVTPAGNGGYLGSPAGYAGGISAVADLDGDGKPEIISGRQAWKVDWTDAATPGDAPTVDVSNYWSSTHPNDGYPAITDLDGDGDPEVILVASGEVVALDGQTGKYWCGVDPTGGACDAVDSLRAQPQPIPGGGFGGPPTVSDFDDDGRPEVGVAGGSSYSVYDFFRPGEQIVKPPADPEPVSGQIYVRWSQPTKDQSSNATGSSVFDFQGDGAAEVVYADECYMRVYSGADGTVQLEIENNSATIHEYPLVVDVDADGNSEILIVANSNGNCLGVDPNHAGPLAGVFVFGDANDEWVPTRRVWTQHTYHVTNATSAGNVPMTEVPSWTAAGVNNYRQNVQGDGVFNAPDLAVSLSVGLSKCVSDQLELFARVTNVGALGVPAGVTVEFYEGTDATGTLLGTETTTQSLLPGASTVVALTIPGSGMPQDFFVTVDGAADSGSVDECDESNNDDATTAAACAVN